MEDTQHDQRLGLLLGYRGYAQMPTNLCFYVVSAPSWVLGMTALSLGPFSLYVFDIGRTML